MISLALTDRKQYQEGIFEALRQEKLICYPTDSLYGLGGMATPKVVEKIDIAKGRLAGKKYSVIAPSWQRMSDHFLLPDDLETLWTQRGNQYGPITVLLTKKDPKRYAFLSDSSQLGVRRLPNHPLQALVSELGHPIITTSCNHSGQLPIVDPHELIEDILLSQHIRYFLHAGPLPGPASTLIFADTPTQIQTRPHFLSKNVS